MDTEGDLLEEKAVRGGAGYSEESENGERGEGRRARGGAVREGAEVQIPLPASSPFRNGRRFEVKEGGREGATLRMCPKFQHKRHRPSDRNPGSPSESVRFK